MNMLIKIISWVLLLVVLPASHAVTNVLFETNFDSVPDWTLTATDSVQTWYLDAGDTVQLTGDADYPYWTAMWIHLDSVPGTAIERAVNSDEDHTSGAGKSMRYVIEKNGTWRGGRVNLGIAEVETELYLQCWVKYEDGFQWGTIGHAQQKFLIMGHFPNILLRTGTTGYLGHGTAYPSAPYPILDWYNNISYPPVQLQMFERGADPDYLAMDETILGVDSAYPGNGWHCYTIRQKMNSAPGVPNGEWEVWIDDVSVGSASAVNWVSSVPWQSGHSYNTMTVSNSSITNSIVIPTTSLIGFYSLTAHTSGGSEPNWASATSDGDVVSDGNGNQWKRFSYCWNTFNFGDNHDFESWNDENEIEESMYFDDIVISTEYVGTEYVIGTPSTAPTVDAGPDQSISVSTATISGTATASTGRTIASVACPGETVTPDDGAWDELEEAWTCVLEGLPEGRTTKTFTATDDQDETGQDSVEVNYTPGGALVIVEFTSSETSTTSGYELVYTVTAPSGEYVVGSTVNSVSVPCYDGACDEQVEEFRSIQELSEGSGNGFTVWGESSGGSNGFDFMSVTYIPGHVVTIGNSGPPTRVGNSGTVITVLN